jgi:hypothetical protein
MKRSLLFVLLGLGAVFSVVANDAPVADIEVIMDLKQFCEDIAEDEGTGDVTLPEFLLTCVNDELEAEGYQPITELPK